MAKYNEQFKIMVVREYLEGKLGYETLAKKHGIKSWSLIKRWVKVFEKFGMDGLMRKKNNEVYSVQFKLDVLSFMKKTGSSEITTALQFGLSTPSLIGSWKKAFLEGGNEALDKPKGRPPIYGFSSFTLSDYRSLSKYLYPHAMANGNVLHLIQCALEHLRKQKKILPSMSTIERSIWEVRKRTEDKIYKLLGASLTTSQIEKLERVLSPIPNSSKSYLAWLKEVPGNFSPESFLRVIEKLEFIRDLELQINTDEIHPNRLRQLSKVGARYEPHSFRRFKGTKRYAILVSYLLDLVQDLTDQAFEIHDRQIMSLLSKGRKAQEELHKQNGKTINEKVVQFADLGTALIQARSRGIDPFVALELVMPWEKLVASVEEAKKLARPIDYDYLDLLEKKFYKLRKYTPTLLKALDFRSSKSAEPLIKAIKVVREMNESGKRKVPEGAPLDFVSNRWQKHVYDDDGTINRHYYEMSVLTELRNLVRSGDVSIVGSRQYKDFEEYLVPVNEWNQIIPSQTRLAVSFSESDYLLERMNHLQKRLEWVAKNVDNLEGVNLENGRLRIDRLEKDVPNEAKEFSLSLYGVPPTFRKFCTLREF